MWSQQLELVIQATSTYKTRKNTGIVIDDGTGVIPGQAINSTTGKPVLRAGGAGTGVTTGTDGTNVRETMFLGGI